MGRQLVIIWLYVATISKLSLQQANLSECPRQRASGVRKITITSTSLMCKRSYVPKSESYQILARGKNQIKCRLRFRETGTAVVRLNNPLSPNEGFHIFGPTYNMTVHQDSPLYGCYVVEGESFEINYYKPKGVQPALNIMVTSVRCATFADDQCRMCNVDRCSQPTAMSNCQNVCISERFVCDRYQQCPFGEDEPCGQISTVTPGTPATIGPTTPVASHIRIVHISPNSTACTARIERLLNQESLITATRYQPWAGHCRYQLYPADGDADKFTVIRFEGDLAPYESIEISGFTGRFTLNDKTEPGECFITTSTFDVNYSASIPSTTYWTLVSTPIDCYQDYCSDYCATSRCHRGKEKACSQGGCIREVNICDRIQQCPMGEDEFCSEMVTVVPRSRCLHRGVIVGITFSAIAVVAAFAGTSFYFYRRHSKKLAAEARGLSSEVSLQPVDGGKQFPAHDPTGGEENLYESA